MLRVASVLLIAVLMSTCAISGTFAKYVTSASVTDSARVAKWGVTIEPSSGVGTAFAEEYGDTVKTGVTGEKVVAPGTTGNLAGVTIKGKPEVKVQVAHTGSITLTGWEVDNAYYCPLIITVNSTVFNGKDYSDLTSFQSAVNAAISALSTGTATYDANTDLETISTANTLITWEWPFYTSAENDVKDTKLGDAATAKIEISMTTTVTQID